LGLSPGTRFGRYEIRSKIGAGGMGDVYLAEDTQLHRHIALKVLTAELAAHSDRMRRFKQEAQAAAALNHPNIAHISAVRFALDAFGRTDSGLGIRDVARDAGLSQRRFSQLFTREVGMSPKLFYRVQRFRQALETVRHAAEPNWAQVAVDCGYYDQSHLIHDFRFFSNLSPTEYVRRRSECVVQNHARWVAAHVSEPAATTVHGATPRRLWATAVAVLGLGSVIIGGLALRRSYGRFGPGKGRTGPSWPWWRD
jgi:AraC-like DNA-binding protein